MELTSRLCRAQEAAQRERAASTPLENVRLVAERAATAWRQAAIEAEQREARRARTRAIAEIAFLQRQRSNEDDQFLARTRIGAEHRFESACTKYPKKLEREWEHYG